MSYTACLYDFAWALIRTISLDQPHGVYRVPVRHDWVPLAVVDSEPVRPATLTYREYRLLSQCENRLIYHEVNARGDFSPLMQAWLHVRQQQCVDDLFRVPPAQDSEHATLEAWEQAVTAMIADVKVRRGIG